METGVDVNRIARDAAGQVRQEEGGGVADLVDRHRAAQGRRAFHVVEDFRKILNAGSGKGLDGARRNRVGADALGAQGFREVTRRSFKCCLPSLSV